MLPLTTDFAQQILALIKMEAYSLLGATQDNKTVLGGSAGSGGGTGEPPAGFVGQLTQSNVTYDTAGSSRACSAGSAGSSSLVDNLDAIRLGTEICDDAIQERHIDWGHGADQVSAVDVPFASTSGSITSTNVRDAIEETYADAGVGPHDLLSVEHTDTLPAAVQRGDIIYGDTTPEWARLPKGAADEILRMDGAGNDPGWGHAALASLASYAQGSIVRGGAADWEALGIGAAGRFLKSDGTDVDWARWAPQVVMVGPSGCEYTLPSQAIAAIGDATAAKPYVVLVTSGSYVESSNVAMKSNVFVMGQHNTTWDFGNGNYLTFQANDSGLFDIKVTSSYNSFTAWIYNSTGHVIRDCTIENTRTSVNGYALYVAGASGVKVYDSKLDGYIGGAYIEGTSTMDLWNCDVHGDLDGLRMNGAGVTARTLWCRMDGDGGGGYYDVRVLAGTWEHIGCQFATMTNAGTETPLPTGKANFDDVVTFENGVTMDGLTTQNIITIPDNFADALSIVDDGDGDVHIRIITTTGSEEVIINDGGDDVDFRVEAVGHPDALGVRGSDGQATLGVLGAGVVQSTAGGVLSSSALAADQLDMGIGDMIFSAADGLLLLNPDGKINDTEWWSLRKQKATLSGAFHQEAGRWLGTRGLVVEEATTNLILNPSIEVDTTSWVDFECTLSRDTTYSVFGDASLKVVTDNAGGIEGPNAVVTAQTAASTEYTFSAYLRGSGTVTLRVHDAGAGHQIGPVITLTDTWTRHEFTVTFGVGADRNFYVLTNIQQDITFYCDGFQLEQQDYATSYCDGTLGTGYAWTGAAHGSTSTRTVTEVNLDALCGVISSNATLSFRVIAQMPYDADATWPAVGNTLFDIHDAGTGDRLAVVYRDDTDVFSVYIDGAYRLASAGQTFKAGDWIDVVITLDFTADDYNLYLNGSLSDNDTTALAAQVASQWNLGSDFLATGGFGGFNITEYGVFDRVLTAIEVAGMYALQRPLIDAGSLDNPPVCNATVWNDIYFPMSSGKIGGANQPTWAAFQGNTFEYAFALNDYIHLPSQEIAHSYEEGSDIKLHVHIVLDGSDAGDTDVNYEIEYTIGNTDEVMSAAAVVTSGDYTITGGTADRTHLFIQVSTIAGATYKIGAALKMRFRRIALVGGGNAPSSDPFVLMVGVHIEEDTVGSRTELAK